MSDPTPLPTLDEHGVPFCTREECPAFDGKRCREMRADYLAAWLHLTNAAVPVLVDGKPATLAERVKWLARQLDAACVVRDNHIEEAKNAQVANNTLRGQLGRMEPLRTVLRSWDWGAIEADGRIPSDAEPQVYRAFAHVEREENEAAKAKEKPCLSG